MFMNAYRRILAAIDLSDVSRGVGARACELAQASGGTVQLLHVIEFVPVEPMSDSVVPAVQMDQQLMDLARRRLDTMAQELGLPPSAGSIEAGSPKSEILRYAREQSIDLIVIGCRERHGLSVLVHRTESSVLHGAPCDVLGVRVREAAPLNTRTRVAAGASGAGQAS